MLKFYISNHFKMTASRDRQKNNLKMLKRFIKREMSTVKSLRLKFLNYATLSFDLQYLKINN